MKEDEINELLKAINGLKGSIGDLSQSISYLAEEIGKQKKK